MSFKARDKAPILNGTKWATLRPLSHPWKGGKDYILTCERVKGGFCTAYIHKPFIIDLKHYQSPIARALGFDKYLARALGFETLGEYLKEPYNQRGETLRKCYLISNVRPNTQGGE